MDPIQNPIGLNDAAVSQLYLAGKGNRSYFDARAIYYLGLSDIGHAKPDSGHPSGD